MILDLRPTYLCTDPSLQLTSCKLPRFPKPFIPRASLVAEKVVSSRVLPDNIREIRVAISSRSSVKAVAYAMCN